MTRSAVERAKRREAKRARTELERLNRWYLVAQYVAGGTNFRTDLQRLDAEDFEAAIGRAVDVAARAPSLDVEDRAEVFEAAGFAVAGLRELFSASEDTLAVRASELAWDDTESDADAYTHEQPFDVYANRHERACTIVLTSWCTIPSKDGTSWVWADDSVATYCRVRELRGVPVVDPRYEAQVRRRLRSPFIGFAVALEGGSNGE